MYLKYHPNFCLYWHVDVSHSCLNLKTKLWYEIIFLQINFHLESVVRGPHSCQHSQFHWLFMNFVWSLSDFVCTLYVLSLYFVWTLSGLCIEVAWTLSWLYLDFVWTLSWLCLDFIWTLFELCLNFVWTLSELCMNFVWS